MATIIEMPKLSDTMAVGTLVSWLREEGDRVEPGDLIAEIETDKATMELENFDEGFLLVRYVEEGDEVEIGAAICAIGEEGEEPPTPPTAPNAASKAEETPEVSEGGERTTESVNRDSPSRDRVKISPLARRIAQEQNVAFELLQGSGPRGRIVKADVLKAIEEGKGPTNLPPSESTEPTATGSTREGETIPVSSIRSTIAQRLLESKTQIPHFYLDIEIDAEPVMKLRKILNQKSEDPKDAQSGIRLTLNDFVLKACATGLPHFPPMNASWQGASIRQHGPVHLAFAVAIDEGLVTPVIRNADRKSLNGISREVKELANKARNRKLTPDEMSGSTFTVSNLGMFGISNFFGIINPPNSAILSVSAILKKPCVNEEGAIAVGHRMMIGMSGDHRVVDGAVGAQFLAHLRSLLENPALIFI